MLIAFKSRPEWSRTTVWPPYKEPALTVELQAQRSMGPEGFEPPPCELKARCAAVTPRPRMRARPRFQICSPCILISFHQSLGMESNHRFRRIRTMCFRYTTKRSRDGRTETTVPWSQTTWGAAPLHPESHQSERLDLNQRSSGPQPGAIPSFATLCRHRVARVGFEPNLTSLKDWQPHQKSNGPLLFGRTFPVFRRTGSSWRWAGRRSNPGTAQRVVLLVFSQALNRLSYQPICVGCSRAAQRKSPVSFA